MIHDIFECAGLYVRSLEPLKKAIEFVRQVPADLAKGKIPIDGEAMFASINTYATKSPEELSFEAHRKYIDVQIVLKGRERIDVTQRTDLPVRQAYAENTDVMFYDPPTNFTSLFVEPGQFVVLYPHDAHRPNITADVPTEVRKLVVKIRV